MRCGFGQTRPVSLMAKKGISLFFPRQELAQSPGGFLTVNLTRGHCQCQRFPLRPVGLWFDAIQAEKDEARTQRRLLVAIHDRISPPSGENNFPAWRSCQLFHRSCVALHGRLDDPRDFRLGRPWVQKCEDQGNSARSDGAPPPSTPRKTGWPVRVGKTTTKPATSLL